jgi:hypothetical protein
MVRLTETRYIFIFSSTLLNTWAKGISSLILPRYFRDGNFFNKIIIGDETCFFAYDPKTKQQSSEWVGETSPQPEKLKFQRSRIKAMLVTFFPTLKE